MFGKALTAVALAFMLGCTAFAADTANVEVTVKGVMQEDKAGMFIVADGQYYDLAFNGENNADMKKFHSGLEGDMVRVKGNLIVEKAKDGKTRLIVQTADVTRLRGERATDVKYSPRVIEEHPVYIEEHHDSGIHLPFVHINW